MIKLVQTWKAYCGLEQQYRIYLDDKSVGHILSAIGAKGIRWQALTIVTLDGAEGFTLDEKTRTKTDAIRTRRRHLKEVPTRLEELLCQNP